jgi:hypothetical protein
VNYDKEVPEVRIIDIEEGNIQQEPIDNENLNIELENESI